MVPVLGLQTPLQRKPEKMKHKLQAPISAMNLRWIPMVEAKLNWLKKQTGESLYYSVPQLSLLHMRCTDAPRRKDLQT